MTEEFKRGNSGLATETTIDTGTNPINGKPSLVTIRHRGDLGNPDGTDKADTTGISERTLVEPITRRIEELERMLDEETNRLDPATRRPMKAITNQEHRARLTRELLHLTQAELPYARAKWTEIQAGRVAKPSANDKLQAELDRKARIQARAMEIAEEEEARAAVEKVRFQRRSTGQGG
ncbi:hypothetical protein [Lysobacter sp. F60174L2]|uniref:hypothetical protein n=1 Tax=Lysobacter sp. F60174L2 TaxID=3459295 RepID=UPI00403D5ED7